MSKGHARITGWQLQKMRHWKMMQNPLCLHCKEKGIVKLGEELDHIVPVYKGGTNEESNFQMLCKDCHHLKTLKDMGYKPKPKIGLDGWPEDAI